MSPIGRIFSVINLVLAALFLGWASVNLATSQEYKDKWETEQQGRQESETALNEEISSLRTQLSTTGEALDQANNEKDRNQSDKDRIADELAKEKADNSEMRASLATLAGSYESIQSQLETQTQLASQAQAAKADADTARDQALRDQEEADRERATVVADNSALQNRISDLEVELNQSGEAIASLVVQLEQLQVLTGASLSDIIPQKKISGTLWRHD